MKGFETTGRMTVEKFERLFQAEFGVYCDLIDQKGNFADESATLASLRPDDFEGPKKVDFSLRANMQVGNVIKKVKENFGIDIIIYELAEPEEKSTLASVSKFTYLKQQKKIAHISDELDKIVASLEDEDEANPVGNKNFIIVYNKTAYADTILWIDEENKIEDLEPFIEFIRCDYDGEEYEFLYADEDHFKVIEFKNFRAISGEEEDTYLLCYEAKIQINLDDHQRFKDALSFSENKIEVVLGFKLDGEEVEECYEPHSNIPTKLQQED